MADRGVFAGQGLDWTVCGFVDFEACLGWKGASAFCSALLALFVADACWPAARAPGVTKGTYGDPLELY